MEIIAGQLDWLTSDEQNLSKFLETETGKRFIPKLAESTPMLLDRGHVNAILIRTGEVRAYRDVIQTILTLAASRTEATPTETNHYPPLEDDTKWNDGQRLEPPKPPEQATE